MKSGMTLEDIVAGIARISEKPQLSGMETQRLTALLAMIEPSNSLRALELLAKRMPGMLRLHDEVLPEWQYLIAGKAAAISSSAAIAWVRTHVSPEVRPGMLATLLDGNSGQLEIYWPELLTREASLSSSNSGRIKDLLLRVVSEKPRLEAMDTLLTLAESYSPKIPMEALSDVINKLRKGQEPEIWPAAWDLMSRVDGLQARKRLRDSIIAGMSASNQQATRDWLDSQPEEVRRAYAAQTLPWASVDEEVHASWQDKDTAPDRTPHIDWLASASPVHVPGEIASWTRVAPEHALAWLNRNPRHAPAAMKHVLTSLSYTSMPADADLREAETAKAAQRPFVQFWLRTAAGDFEAFRAGIVNVGQREIINLAVQP